MKTGIKILIWSVVSGGIGFFGGWTVAGRKISGLQDRVDELTAKSKELEEIANILAGNTKDDAQKEDGTAEGIRKGYESKPEETAEAATDDDPPMPEEPPVIGDEDAVERSPAIEFITEEEYYENKNGYAEESLIWYSMDEVLWNKDTQSRMSREEIGKSIGYGTLDIFDREPEKSLFVRNHVLPATFRIDFMDAAWCDEHNRDEVDDD